MAGKNPYEQALVDQYVDGWQDIYDGYFDVVKNIFVGDLEAAVAKILPLNERTGVFMP